MPDFTMCVAEDCEFSVRCRRHSDSGTVASQEQSFANFFEHYTPNYGCLEFVSLSRLLKDRVYEL
jgi:hypothetical protein